MSKISALRRGQDFLYIAASGHLVVKPSPDFLAKTEDPNSRRKPWKISPLSGDDPSLCPVTNVQAYLKRTSEFSTGSLFRHHLSGKPLSITATKCHLTTLIKRTNPESIPKSHDIRKLASSLAFFEGMSFPDIASMTGWSSPNVFIKHYLYEINTLLSSCVVLGKTLVPMPGPSSV